MKIGFISVPYLTVEEHRKKMTQTYNSIESKEHDIYKIAIVNGASEEDLELIRSFNDYTEVNDENCLAKAWNKGIKEARDEGCDLYIISNLDVILNKDTIDELVKIEDLMLWSPYEVRTTDGAVVSYQTNGFLSFSFFAIKPECIDKVGYFDEAFKPLYWEDVDYSYRMKLQGLRYEGVPTCSFKHYGSSAINDAKIDIMPSYVENMKYYISKWGGGRGQEVFKTPFNK